MFSSIRWRLVASYFLVALVTISVLGLALLSILSTFYLQEEKAHLQRNAEALATRVAPLWAGQDPSRWMSLVAAYGLLSQARIRVLDSSRRLLLDSSNNAENLRIGFSWADPRRGGAQVEVGLNLLPRLSEPDECATLLVDMNSPWGGFVLGGEQAKPLPASAQGNEPPTSSGLSVLVPIQGAKGILGYVQMSRDLARGRQILRTTRSALLFAGLAAVVFAIGTGLWMSQTLTAPLKALASAAKSMAHGNLCVRAPADRNDEIGQVARQFNHMAESLQKSFAALEADRDALRRFAADASHELRTPIAALKTFNELLQGPAQDDAEARREFLAESQAQIERLDWLTQNLLQLSRLDSGLLQMELEPHSLSELVGHSIALFEPQAQEKGIALHVELPTSNLQARYDRQWLEQALDNLVSNAIKFTPPGGRVTIGVAENGGMAEVWVEDTGIGIPAEDLPYVFDRFYRGKKVAEKGSGLGLSIAQAVLRAHGSEIQVTSEEGVGSRFSFRLPIASDAA